MGAVFVHYDYRGRIVEEQFDLKDPSKPKEISVFANNDVPGTWQEKVIVKSSKPNILRVIWQW